jgi:hypothetical protein
MMHKLTATPKVQTVLRTRVPLKSDNKAPVSSKTRVVVTSITENGKVRARTASGEFVTATPSAFYRQFRGRPRNDGKQVTLTKQSVQ